MLRKRGLRSAGSIESNLAYAARMEVYIIREMKGLKRSHSIVKFRVELVSKMTSY